MYILMNTMQQYGNEGEGRYSEGHVLTSPHRTTGSAISRITTSICIHQPLLLPYNGVLGLNLIIMLPLQYHVFYILKLVI